MLGNSQIVEEMKDHAVRMMPNFKKPPEQKKTEAWDVFTCDVGVSENRVVP